MVLRPWLWRLTHSRIFWGVSTCLLLALLALFYAITNTWGSWELERVRQDLTMRGCAFTWKDVLRTNPPPDEDLLRHEVMKRRPAQVDEALVKMGYKQNDLNLWSLQPKDGKQFSAAAICGKPGTDEQVANEQLLRDLSMMEPTTHEVKAAVRSSTSIGWEVSGTLSMLNDPTLPMVSWIASTIPRRAVLRAAAGDSEGAMDDLRLSYEYLELLNKQPRRMLGVVIGSGFAAILVNHSWQIIQEPSVTPAYLREMDQWFAKLDLGKPTVDCYLREIAFVNEYTEMVFGTITAGILKDVNWSIAWQDPKAWWPTAKDWWRQIRPVGLAKLELASALQQIDREIIHLPDGGKRNSWTSEDADRIVTLAPTDFADSDPRAHLYATAEPFIRRQLKLQTVQRIVRVGIAIELYWRKNGNFPDSIQALVPDYLDRIPLDAQSGKPITLEISPSGALLITAPGVNAKTKISWPIIAK